MFLLALCFQRNVFRRLTQGNVFANNENNNEWPRSAQDEAGIDGVYYPARADRSLATKGLKPNDMEVFRRSSIALRAQLKGSPHAPYSIWPRNEPTPGESGLTINGQRLSTISYDSHNRTRF